MLALLSLLVTLVLPTQPTDQAAPVVQALEGRVLVLDARHGARPCARTEALRAEAQGALELGAGAAARWSLAQRTAVHWEGATSCEWSRSGLTVLAFDRMRWDWREAGQMLRLPASWLACGGPGVYEVQSDAHSWTVRTLAGAPLLLHEGTQLRATVVAGAVTKLAAPRVQLAVPAVQARLSPWREHGWPWSAPETQVEAEDNEPVDLWSPATIACAAPRFAPLRVTTVGRQVRLTPSGAPNAVPTVVPQWPPWLLDPLAHMLDRLHDRWRAWSAWAVRLRAMQAYGVRFDLWGPFDVRFEDDRLRLRLDARAGRAYVVRGMSWLTLQPGAAVVLERGGRLASHAGEVAVRPLQ